MKSDTPRTPKIPRGWRRLRTGSKIKSGDRLWSEWGYWRDDIPFPDRGVINDAETIIRRVAKRRAT